MGTKQTNALFARQLTIPTRTTGKKLYDLLGVNPENELVILIKPHDEVLNSKYLIIPDNRAIELPTIDESSILPEYLIMIIKNEIFFENFDLRTSYPN